MELEKQVVSLDLSKKLKELGVRQESYFFWVQDYQPIREDFKSTKTVEVDRENKPYITTNYGSLNSERLASAYTVAELGEFMKRMLVMTFPVPDKETGYQCDLEDIVSCTANTEADARAKMLIYLLENKLIQLS